MYSTDTHTSTSFSSNPSTPVASPPPLISDGPVVTAATQSSLAWANTPQNQNEASPAFDNMQQLNRMQETLDDAIWVLKSHAESSLQRTQNISSYPPSTNPQTLTDQLQVSRMITIILLKFNLNHRWHFTCSKSIMETPEQFAKYAQTSQ